jgi:site-specific DNA recombinase
MNSESVLARVIWIGYSKIPSIKVNSGGKENCTPALTLRLFPWDASSKSRRFFVATISPDTRHVTLLIGGVLTCAYDNCKVTAEIKRRRYTYYHCTGYRGKCGLPYIREEELGDRLGQILKDIHIPDDILAQLQESLLNDKGREEEIRRHQGERLAQRLSQVHRRMDQAYQDKLDGKISEEFWMRKSGEWQAEENQIQTSMQGLKTVRLERLLDAAKILELANKAYFLYVN